MTLNEIKDLQWTSVTNWDNLKTTNNGYGGTVVTSLNVKEFVEDIFHDVAKQLDIPYASLRPTLYAENIQFFMELKEIFGYHNYSKNSDCLIKLEEKLRIPDTSNVSPNVNDLLSSFARLSSEDKMYFVSQISKC